MTPDDGRMRKKRGDERAYSGPYNLHQTPSDPTPSRARGLEGLKYNNVVLCHEHVEVCASRLK